MTNEEFEQHIYDKIQKNNCNKKIAVALSGGCDSLSLTLALKNIGIDILAILVNHHLRKEADEEIVKTIKILKKFNIKYVVQNWDGKYKNNLEADARNVRYNLLLKTCKNKKINILCIGHHADDQIETFLINLARGSGLDGLCSMPFEKKINNIRIIRPMIDLTKQDCKNYLLNLKIKWCEDKSNFDLKYKRNKLRFLLNEIEDKNLITKRILQTIKTFQEVKETLDLIITKTEKKILKKNNNEIILNREKFISLSEYFKKSILTKCIVQLSCSNYKPRLYQIENIINSITKKTDFKRTIMNLTISCKNNIIKIKKN